MSSERDTLDPEPATTSPLESAEKAGTKQDEFSPLADQGWTAGWRLAAIAAGQALSFFMVQAESSITSTAITSITDSLGDFKISSWVFTAYLLTYSAFPIILSKVSDILGRKQVLLGCIVSFVIFSGACGAAQSLLQLIMFRWIKGLGAGGIVAICTGYGFELRPPEKWPSYSAFLTLTGAVSMAISPLIGAALSEANQWRWCFLINVPVGAAAAALLFIAMPNKLRLEPAARLMGPASRRERLSRLRKLDFPGVVLFVGASVLLMVALQQAAEGVSFGAPKVFVLLIIAPIFLVGFLALQKVISLGRLDLDSVFPWRMLCNRAFLGVIGNCWLSGMVLTAIIVQVPQRFMLVNGLSAIDAGVRLLPFTIVIPSTAIILSAVMSKRGVPALATLSFGACLQVAGVAGISQLSSDASINGSIYAFQVLAGAGVGLVYIITILLTPQLVEQRDIAVGTGAVNQFRILGGTLGVAIVTCATLPDLRKKLVSVLDPKDVLMVLDRTDTIQQLSEDRQALVRRAFGDIYNTQMTILIGIAAAQVLVSLLLWRKETIMLKK